MPTFAELVQDLPAEIFNEIYGLVMEFEEGDVVKINKNFKPPWQLQISSGFRTTLFPRFYSDKIFEIDYRDEKIFIKWLAGIVRFRFFKLGEIHVNIVHKPIADYDLLLVKLESALWYSQKCVEENATASVDNYYMDRKLKCKVLKIDWDDNGNPTGTRVVWMSRLELIQERKDWTKRA